jgi:hypothetical protein
MQNSVLPKTAGLKEWGYTLIGLFLLTGFLVLNLQNITAIGRWLRKYQDRAWIILYQLLVVDTGLKSWLERRNAGAPEDGIELDDQGGEGGPSANATV